MSVRLPTALLQEVDAMAAKTKLKRSDLVRQLITLGLNHLNGARG